MNVYYENLCAVSTSVSVVYSLVLLTHNHACLGLIFRFHFRRQISLLQHIYIITLPLL